MIVLPIEVKKMLHEAEKIIKSDDSFQQIVVVCTAKAHTYTLLNHNIVEGNLTDEENFINKLVEEKDTEINYIICMWNTCELDISSHHLRSLLVKVNPLNRDAMHLLYGDGKYITKKLKDLEPMAKKMQ